MSYHFYFIIKKFFNFVTVNLLFPLAIFILISPVSFLLIYSLENKIENEIQESDVDIIFSSTDTELYNQKIKLPAEEINMEIKLKDYRAEVLDTYFAQYNSPLEGYGDAFVDACNKYDAPSDCTTLPGIAYVETKLCTLANSLQEQNCWGFGGSPPNRIHFEDFYAATDLITDRLVNSYGPKFMTDPVRMQYIYCGPNCHSWGAGVQQQRLAISRLSEEMGYPALIK